MRKFVGGFSNDVIKLVIHLVDSKVKTPSPLLWASDLRHSGAFNVGVRVQQPCATRRQSQLFSGAVQSLLKVWALPRRGVAAFVQILTRLNVQFLNAATTEPASLWPTMESELFSIYVQGINWKSSYVYFPTPPYREETELLWNKGVFVSITFHFSDTDDHENLSLQISCLCLTPLSWIAL